MQPFDKGESFTVSLTAYDSSNNTIGTITQADNTGATFGSYNIMPVGVRSSLTPINSIVIKIVELGLAAFAIGEVYFDPGKPNSCNRYREGALDCKHAGLLSVGGNSPNTVYHPSIAFYLEAHPYSQSEPSGR